MGDDPLEVLIHSHDDHRTIGHEHPKSRGHLGHRRQLIATRQDAFCEFGGRVLGQTSHLFVDDDGLRATGMTGDHLEIQGDPSRMSYALTGVRHADIARRLRAHGIFAWAQGESVAAFLIGSDHMARCADLRVRDGVASSRIRYQANEGACLSR